MADTLIQDPAAPVTPPAAGGDAPVTPTAPVTGFVGDDGNFNDGWLDRLPEELKPAAPTLGKYRSLPDLAKAHFHLQQRLGKHAEAVYVPADDAPEEEKAAYRKAIGVPDSPELYGLKPETLPDGVEWSPELEGTFSTIAHKHGVPAAAMKELAAAYADLQGNVAKQQVELMEQELSKGKELLKDAWKGNFDVNLGKATRAAKTLGLNPESPGLRDPQVVIALARMADMVSEDKLVSGDFSPTSKPGKARALSIINGDDPSTAHLHAKYQKGDEDTVKMVRDMLKNG